VDTLIVTGTATNACCESTARSAFMRDYQVLFPSDANATFDQAMHLATLINIELFFGRVMTTDELLAEMQESLQAAPGAAAAKIDASKKRENSVAVRIETE
jgi:nicotinamidase-related amidase